MEREPLIHVGYQKAASTFFQQHVFGSSACGFYSHGVDGRAALIDSFTLVNPYAFDPRQARDNCLRMLYGGSNGSLVPVLSDENLVGHPTASFVQGPAIAERLHAAFPRARVVIGIREQRSAVLSYYGQHLRQSYTHSIDTFLGDEHMPPGALSVLRRDFYRYDQLIEHYQRLFGSDRVLVLPIELLSETEGFVRRLCAFARADPPELAALPSVHSNAAHGGATLVCRRWLNLAAPKPDYTRTRQPLRFRAVRNACGALDRGLPTWLQERARRRLAHAVESRLSGEYAASNRRTGELIGVDLGELGYDV